MRCFNDDSGGKESPPNYLFSTFPGFEGRKPPIGVGDGNGAGRGAPKDGAGVGDGTGRAVAGWLGHGAAGAATAGLGDAGIGRGAGAVNGAGDTGFGADANVTAGLIAMVFAFTLARALTFLAVFFAATRFFANFLTADFPFLRARIARFAFFTFFFDCFALRFDVLAMIAS